MTFRKPEYTAIILCLLAAFTDLLPLIILNACSPIFSLSKGLMTVLKTFRTCPPSLVLGSHSKLGQELHPKAKTVYKMG